MHRDLAVLQCVKLLELLEAERENIVIKRLRCAAEKPFERRFIAGRVARVNGNGSTNVTPGLALQPQARIGDGQIEPASVRSAIHRLVAFRTSPFLESEQHGTKERHERALACFVRPVEDVQSAAERTPGFVVPDSETIDVDVFDSHDLYDSSSRSTPSADAR